MKKCFYVLFIVLISCNENKKNKTLDNQEKLNDGQALFQKHCTSCHHFANYKEGFVFPSIQDIVSMDSLKRIEMINKLTSDTTHKFIITKLSSAEKELLVYYLTKTK